MDNLEIVVLSAFTTIVTWMGAWYCISVVANASVKISYIVWGG